MLLNLKSICCYFLATLLCSQSAEAARKGFQLSTFNSPLTLQEHVSNLQSLGADIFRFPIYIYHDSLQHWLAKIEAVLQVAEPHNSVVVVTIHGGPDESDLSPQYNQHFVDWWGEIAKRLHAHANVWYDLDNEPHSSGWRDTALAAAKRIRRFDANNYIVYCPGGSSTYSYRDATPLNGIHRQIFTFHFYNWYDAVQSPSASGIYPTTRFSKSQMAEDLRNVVRLSKKYNTPVLIGEVAIRRDAPGAPAFMSDFTDLVNHFNIPLTIHAFREADVWDYEKTNTLWTILEDWLHK